MIHRDIKPENIFINESGGFKLGDFGIARTIENTTGNLSQKGTYNYMAPEVYHGESYNENVDFYSLGMVLYFLSNDRTLPFLDVNKKPYNIRQKKEALNRRFKGEQLLPPCNASEDFGRVILKACEYDPKARYQTAAEMKKALIEVRKRIVEKKEEEDPDKTARVRQAPDLQKVQDKPEEPVEGDLTIAVWQEGAVPSEGRSLSTVPGHHGTPVQQEKIDAGQHGQSRDAELKGNRNDPGQQRTGSTPGRQEQGNGAEKLSQGSTSVQQKQGAAAERKARQRQGGEPGTADQSGTAVNQEKENLKEAQNRAGTSGRQETAMRQVQRGYGNNTAQNGKSDGTAGRTYPGGRGESKCRPERIREQI